MQDRIVETPNRYMLVPVEGEENQFDLYPVPGTVTQAGTPLTKANLLSDTTAGKYVATADVPESTPDDVLDLLATALVWDGSNMTSVKGVVSGVNIASGTYTGTGTAGSANKNTLSFGFAPKLLFVSAGGQGNYIRHFTAAQNQPRAQSEHGSTTAYVSLTWSGDTVSWWDASGSATTQLNDSGETYYYFAIG